MEQEYRSDFLEEKFPLARIQTIGKVAIGTLCAITPFAGAVTAIEYGPPATIQIAGEAVSVKPEIGNTVSFTDPAIGEISLPSHTNALGVPIGISLGGNVRTFLDQPDLVVESAVKQILDDPEPEKGRVEAAARNYLIRQALLGASLAGLVEAGAVVLIRRRGKHGTLSAIGALASTVVLAGSYVAPAQLLSTPDRAAVASPALRGTLLEGATINITPEKATQIIDLLTEPKTPIFDRAVDEFSTIIDQRPDLAESGWDTYVVADDLESVNGMAKVTGALAAKLRAQGIIILGDMTFSGRSIESAIIDTLDHSAGDIPILMTAGHHDTTAILDTAKDRGWTLGSDTVQSFAGLQILALNDPYVSTLSTFRSGKQLRDPAVSEDEFMKQAIGEACDTTPDIAVGHDNKLLQKIAESGCVQLTIDGRSFAQTGVRQYQTLTGEKSVEYTIRSSGGHKNTAFSRGMLQTTADLMVLQVNESTKEARYAVASVTPDGYAEISPLNHLANLPVDAEQASSVHGKGPHANKQAAGTKTGENAKTK